MSEDTGNDAKDTVALTLSRHVLRQLELWAVLQDVPLDAVIEAALCAYLAVVEECDPEVRAFVRVLTAPPAEPP